jgi:hypothetical protein
MRLMKKTILVLALTGLAGCGKEKEAYPPAKLVWSQTGSQSHELFGHKAAGVGDVTGQGYDGLLIGGPGYDDRRGRAVLYMGSADGLGQKPVWEAEGEKPGDGFGDVVGALGDINGDGYMDFFVSAPEYSTAKLHHCGKVYIYLGGPHGPGAKPAWTAEGTTPEELFGDCAASVGDVNGDGYPDFMIGAYGFDKFRGKVYLYLGSSRGYGKKADWTFEGEDQGDWMGYGIGPAGDVKGNGYDDVLLGSKYHNHPFHNAGKVYLFYGSSRGLSSTPDWVHYGEAAESRFGHHLSGAGDVNGDGYADVVVGAPGFDRSRGRAYLFLGSSSGLKDQPDSVMEGQVTGESFGTDVGSAEYTQGDGYAGVLVGGPGYATFPGSANLYLGSPAGVSRLPQNRELGEAGGNSFGSIIGSAGDVNGSGIPDWFVCAPGFGADGTELGKVYVYQSARPEGLTAHIRLCREPRHTLVGPGGAIRFGKESPFLAVTAGSFSGEFQLQAEVKESGKAFEGNGLITSEWMAQDHGTNGLEVTGLVPGKAYRWRGRLVLKDGRISQWYYPSFGRLCGSPNFRLIP